MLIQLNFMLPIGLVVIFKRGLWKITTDNDRIMFIHQLAPYTWGRCMRYLSIFKVEVIIPEFLTVFILGYTLNRYDFPDSKPPFAGCYCGFEYNTLISVQ
jgi:hypothetical protein